MSRDTPTVSVLIAARNAATTIDRQVQSVLSQRGVSLELLMCDDASTDATFARMSRWSADPRVRIFRNHQRLHPSGARNRLLEMARGRYCSPCDADDLLMPDALSSLVGPLEGHPAAGVAYGTLLRVLVEPGRTAPPDFLPAGEAIWDLFANRVSHAGSVIRTSLIREVGGYDASLHLSEDWDLLLKLRERCEFLPVRNRITYIWQIRKRSRGRVGRGRHRLVAGIVLRAARRRLALGLGSL